LADALLTASPDAIVLLDQAGHILRTNPAAARLLDTPDAIGRLITSLLPELTSVHPGQTTIHRHSPAATWWDLTITPGHLLIARDITETVLIRQTLALTEARLRTATESARSMFWIIRLDGRVAFTSQRWRDFTGISHPDISIDDWLPRIHP
jgi:PAS domain-containing protein